MKTMHKVITLLVALVSFFTTVLCMKDVLSVRDEMQEAQNAAKH